MDDKLSWNKDIDKVANEIASGIGAIRKICDFVDQNLPETEGQTNQDSSGHLPFDPVARDPSWEPSRLFKEFLEANFREGLSSSQILSILEETSLSCLYVFTTPKLDKVATDQIPKNNKKSIENRDKELIKGSTVSKLLTGETIYPPFVIFIFRYKNMQISISLTP